MFAVRLRVPRVACLCALAVLPVMAVAGTARAEDGSPFDDAQPLGARVERALQRAVERLEHVQAADGTFGALAANGAYGGASESVPEAAGRRGLAGVTALCLLAWLRSGERVDSRRVQRGFEWIREHDRLPGDAMEASAVLLALAASAGETVRGRRRLTARERRHARDLVDHLLRIRAFGGWRYDGSFVADGPPVDLACTHLVLWALFEADRLGLRVAGDVWRDAIRRVLALRVVTPSDTAGVHGFAYADEGAARERGPGIAMTACGIGALLMARHALTRDARGRRAWDAGDLAQPVAQAIDEGLRWLGACAKRGWRGPSAPGATQVIEPAFASYVPFAVTLALDLVGRGELLGVPWADELAAVVVRRQRADGSFAYGSIPPLGSEHVDTALAALALARPTRGTVPPLPTRDD